MGAQITVIVCTRDRAAWLSDALLSLATQSLPANLFDIVVVDNASSDETREIVIQFQKRQSVHYIYEERLGIAIARNRGWQEAKTEFVVYMDDDARAESNWLETHLTTFQTVHPQPACITGAVDLEWVGGRPAWYPTEYESLIARYDFGPEPKWHDRNGYLVTCNAAFRRQTLVELGGFLEGLGHRGLEVHGGEDNEMFSRLLVHGFPIYYQPRARVKHLTPPERQTRRHLLQRVFATGLTQAFLDQLHYKRARTDIWRSLWWDTRMTVWYLLKTLIAILSLRSSNGWDNFYSAVQKLGKLRTEFALVGLPLTSRDALRVQQLGDSANSKV